MLAHSGNFPAGTQESVAPSPSGDSPLPGTLPREAFPRSLPARAQVVQLWLKTHFGVDSEGLCRSTLLLDTFTV